MIRPAERVEGSIRVPGSKSLTLRAIVCGALARGDSVVENALLSSDSIGIARALGAAGASIEIDADAHRLRIAGMGGPPSVADARLDVADCGTCMRILMAVVAAGKGSFLLDGTPRMRQRPVGGLGRALERQGASVRYELDEGRPPVRIVAGGLAGGDAEVDAAESSQYVTGLLLAAPFARGPMTVIPQGEFPSRPYVELTLEVMRAFGSEVERGDVGFSVVPGGYRATRYEVEGDYSSASYFFAAAAVARGSVEVEGIRVDSSQGDRHFLRFLEALGSRVRPTERGIRVDGDDRRGDVTFDFGDCPDVVPTAAIAAAFHEGRVTITGAPHLRLKESDRIATVCTELRKLGAKTEERNDGLVVYGGRPLSGATIDTHDDHRIAMSFAVAGLCVPGVILRDPDCTAKSYPCFFDDLERVTRR